MNSTWRFNPFTDTKNWKSITAEYQLIEYWEEVDAYGFFLNESAKLDSPSSVTIVDADTLADFEEVSKLTSPNPGQFRVDYDDENYYNTGFVECNSADDGKRAKIGYSGGGSITRFPVFCGRYSNTVTTKLKSAVYTEIESFLQANTRPHSHPVNGQYYSVIGYLISGTSEYLPIIDFFMDADEVVITYTGAGGVFTKGDLSIPKASASQISYQIIFTTLFY